MTLAKATIVDGHKVQFAAVDTAMTGKVGQKTIDMTPFAGQVVRVWIDEGLGFSTDPAGRHLWQVAEMAVPAIGYQTVLVEDPETQEQVEQSVPVPLDLNVCPITLWPLPE